MGSRSEGAPTPHQREARDTTVKRTLSNVATRVLNGRVAIDTRQQSQADSVVPGVRIREPVDRHHWTAYLKA